MKNLFRLLLLCTFSLFAFAETISGIGASLASRGGKHLIRGLFDGGPAAASGQLQKGDQILAVAQGDSEPVSVEGLSSREVAELIMGKSGSTVRLTILPKDAPDGQTRIVSLTRAEVAVGPPPPPEVGQVAPDAEITVVATGKTERISDHAGKIRVVDFWATWCGPCQPAMAKMQTYKEHHPEWGDKVLMMSVSTDRDADTAKAHLDKKGWHETYNTWSAEAPALYGITGIPHCYILDAEGKVVAHGHPMGMDIGAIVGELLGLPAAVEEEK